MNSQLREQAVNLRLKEELSYSEIRKRLGVPKSTLSNWLCDFPLSEKKILELRRKGWKNGEASRERFRNTMRKKQELKSQEIYKKYRKKFKNISKDAFFVAGLMIYLGEGGKTNYAQINLANTDPRIIKFFIKWLVNFFDIERSIIKAELHLYENMDIDKEKEFWRSEIGFSENQFYKTQIRKLQKGSFTYRGSYRHGTCSIYVLGVERKRELMMAIQAFVDQYIQ